MSSNQPRDPRFVRDVRRYIARADDQARTGIETRHQARREELTVGRNAILRGARNQGSRISNLRRARNPDGRMITTRARRLPSPDSARGWAFRIGFLQNPPTLRDVTNTVARLTTTINSGAWTYSDTGVVNALVCAYYVSGRDEGIRRAVQTMFDRFGWTHLNLGHPSIMNIMRCIDNGQCIAQIAIDFFARPAYSGFGLPPAWDLVRVHGWLLRVPAGSSRHVFMGMSAQTAQNAYIHQLLTNYLPGTPVVSVEDLRIAGLLTRAETAAAIQ